MENELRSGYFDFHVEDFVILQFADGSTLRLNSDDVLELIESKSGAPMDS